MPRIVLLDTGPLGMVSHQEAHRSRPAAGRDQQGVGPREVDPARAPEHAALVVGAVAIGGGDFHAGGGRPV